MATGTKKKLGGVSLGGGGCNVKADSRNSGRGPGMRNGGRHIGLGLEERGTSWVR